MLRVKQNHSEDSDKCLLCLGGLTSVSIAYKGRSWIPQVFLNNFFRTVFLGTFPFCRSLRSHVERVELTQASSFLGSPSTRADQLSFLVKKNFCYTKKKKSGNYMWMTGKKLFYLSWLFLDFLWIPTQSLSDPSPPGSHGRSSSKESKQLPAISSAARAGTASLCYLGLGDWVWFLPLLSRLILDKYLTSAELKFFSL